MSQSTHQAIKLLQIHLLKRKLTQARIPILGSSHITRETMHGTLRSMTNPTRRLGTMSRNTHLVIKWLQIHLPKRKLTQARIPTLGSSHITRETMHGTLKSMISQMRRLGTMSQSTHPDIKWLQIHLFKVNLKDHINQELRKKTTTSELKLILKLFHMLWEIMPGT